MPSTNTRHYRQHGDHGICDLCGMRAQFWGALPSCPALDTLAWSAGATLAAAVRESLKRDKSWPPEQQRRDMLEIAAACFDRG